MRYYWYDSEIVVQIIAKRASRVIEKRPYVPVDLEHLHALECCLRAYQCVLVSRIMEMSFKGTTNPLCAASKRSIYRAGMHIMQQAQAPTNRPGSRSSIEESNRSTPQIAVGATCARKGRSDFCAGASRGNAAHNSSHMDRAPSHRASENFRDRGTTITASPRQVSAAVTTPILSRTPSPATLSLSRIFGHLPQNTDRHG